MRLLGEAQVILCNDKHSTHSTVLVAADLNHAALIVWQDLQKLCVIPASFPAVAAVVQRYKDMKTKTLAAFPSVFSDTLDNKPMCTQKMHIHMCAVPIHGHIRCYMYGTSMGTIHLSRNLTVAHAMYIASIRGV